MKIICAGYPKTGSKSCSGALRVLGFKVADWLETAEFFGSTWRDYIDEKISIEDVLDKYNELGFDANQDYPGNFLWEELYLASPKGSVYLCSSMLRVHQTGVRSCPCYPHVRHPVRHSKNGACTMFGLIMVTRHLESKLWTVRTV